MKFFPEKDFNSLAAPLLRCGLAIVFLWFGFSQLHNPQEWTSFLPSWISILPISEESFIMMNGLFEVVGAFLLLLGAYVRVTASLLGLHLLGIAVSIGLSNTGVRDLGLSIATISSAFLGAGKFSIDNLVQMQKNNIEILSETNE